MNNITANIRSSLALALSLALSGCLVDNNPYVKASTDTKQDTLSSSRQTDQSTTNGQTGASGTTETLTSDATASDAADLSKNTNNGKRTTNITSSADTTTSTSSTTTIAPSTTSTTTNHAPVASNDTASGMEDTKLTLSNLLANDTDVDGDALTIKSFAQALHGTVTKNANGVLEYMPANDYYGQDSFTYTVADASGLESTATVGINVTDVNDIPKAVNDSISLLRNNIANIAVLGNDSGLGDAPYTLLTASSVSNGTLKVDNNGVFTYTPAAQFLGTDSFTYKVTDANGDTAIATVSITVNCESVCTKTLKLSWTASASANVASYKVYVGNSSGTYTKNINVGNVTSYDYTVSASGTYYFAVTALDTNNIESNYSNEALGTM